MIARNPRIPDCGPTKQNIGVRGDILPIILHAIILLRLDSTLFSIAFATSFTQMKSNGQIRQLTPSYPVGTGG